MELLSTFKNVDNIYPLKVWTKSTFIRKIAYKRNFLSFIETTKNASE